MTKKLWHFDLNPNMGRIDRIARYTLSILLIGILLVVSPTPAGLVVLLPLIAIPIFISAFAGWDPVYALCQKLPTPKLSSTAVNLSHAAK